MSTSTLMHVSTHSRGKGHSSVAAAAYRLGARLADQRTGVICDFAGKGGVVSSIHMVPPGADESLRDVGTCWNEVEAAEKRKDSQVCRDFREAVPLGLDQNQAEKMMLDWSTYLSEKYNTVITSALHRDNARDAFGVEKTEQGRGFHIHALMPTRSIGPDGSFGPKLDQLSNKRLSAVEIEIVREKWADLCNEYALKLGLEKTYDHRSHMRRGDGIVAEKTIGVDATAMARRGVETEKSAEVKAHREAMRIPMHVDAILPKAKLAPFMFDQSTVDELKRLRDQTKKDLEKAAENLLIAERKRDADARRFERENQERKRANGMMGKCKKAIEKAQDDHRRAIPFFQWRKRRNALEIAKTNMTFFGQYRQIRETAKKREAIAAKELERSNINLEQEREKHEEALRIDRDIKRTMARLTPEQRAQLEPVKTLEREHVQEPPRRQMMRVR